MAKILVVEDEPNIRLVLKIALEEEGHQVLTTANGQEGIELLAQELRPDVILADLHMPQLGGRAFIETIRANNAFLNIPIAIITGSIPTSNELPSKDKYQALISKPFDLDDIYKTVEQLTGSACYGLAG